MDTNRRTQAMVMMCFNRHQRRGLKQKQECHRTTTRYTDHRENTEANVELACLPIISACQDSSTRPCTGRETEKQTQ
ncbi:hypothetical protein DPMN_112702 [Dreissena polymorpha]|uniref:Uncharacterized protein n=1 Tax=Dreissena polymorpha TaxID=45954 RepID=A0A9D4KHL6_DREPO|nr:hypothetical protein DPMN_112702 [Dreissena polymorpha]